MSARAIGTVTVSFGLVSIPVKLYSANQTQSGVSFNMLHKSCGSRLKQQYICSTENVVVGREDTAKGYEYAKGQYVVFSEDELKVLEEAPTETIEITEFVDAAKVDPVFFEKAYYLGPDKGGDKAYALLGAAMKATNRCALARYAARGKQYLVLLRPHEKRLVMQQLRYADEVRPATEVPVPDVEVRDPELKLALQLIDQIASDQFKPEQYEDATKKRTLALIQKKVEGQQVVAPPPAAAPGQIIDLMEALKASLGGAPKAAPAPAPAAASAPAPAAETQEQPAAEAPLEAPAAERKGPKAKPPKSAKGEEAAAKKKSRKTG